MAQSGRLQTQETTLGIQRTSTNIRFPRRRAAIFIVVDDEGGWLTLVGSHGWLFGSRQEALTEAWWLSKNLGLPIRYQQSK
jgi:hypothetical protein